VGRRLAISSGWVTVIAAVLPRDMSARAREVPRDMSPRAQGVGQSGRT
jgi:hypothetical protein